MNLRNKGNQNRNRKENDYEHQHTVDGGIHCVIHLCAPFGGQIAPRMFVIVFLHPASLLLWNNRRKPCNMQEMSSQSPQQEEL